MVCTVLSSCSSKSVCGVHVCCSFTFSSIVLFLVFVCSHPQYIQSIKYLHTYTDGIGFCLPAHLGEFSASYVLFSVCYSTLEGSLHPLMVTTHTNRVLLGGVVPSAVTSATRWYRMENSSYMKVLTTRSVGYLEKPGYDFWEERLLLSFSNICIYIYVFRNRSGMQSSSIIFKRWQTSPLSNSHQNNLDG